MEILDQLEPLLKMFWYIALPSSLFFVGQTIMTFMGSDASDGIDADFDGDLVGADAPLQLFSLRNLVNFLLGFSWAGISFYSSIENKALLIVLALLVGVLFVGLFFSIIRQIQKLAENNSFKIHETLNKSAEVYLQIPANKSGKGKIMISIRGSFHELDAITEQEEIKRGAIVKVVRIESDNLLVVENL